MTEQDKQYVINALKTISKHKASIACKPCAKTAEFALELLKSIDEQPKHSQAKLIIKMPRNCLSCDILKEWYGTERDTTFVRCHAGKCEMKGHPGDYEKSNTRPDYCPLLDE